MSILDPAGVCVTLAVAAAGAAALAAFWVLSRRRPRTAAAIRE
jgi:MYXO-CTERM domain-containing protein